jgi:ClpP class serine protease
LIDNGPFVGNEALKGGLVDALIYEDQMYGQLQDRVKTGNLNKIGEHDYMRAPSAGLGVEGPTRIALLVGEGDITRGATNDQGTDTGITASGMVKLLRQVRDDASIKGVILRIDSPAATGSPPMTFCMRPSCSARRSRR